MQPGVHIFIQARMSSVRLPGKALRTLGGRTLLSHVIARAASTGLPLAVLTSTSDADEAIARHCIDTGVSVFRGPEEDVLARFCLAVAEYGAKTVVRLTGDNPFTPPEIIARCLHAHAAMDLTSTRRIKDGVIVERSSPKGWSVDVMSTEALLRAQTLAQTAAAREHVIPIFFDGAFSTRLVPLDLPASALALDLSIDTEDGLRRAETLLAKAGPEATLGMLLEHATL